MTAQAPTEIWTALKRAGLRFIAPENSHFLFLERTDAETSLSLEAAQGIDALGAVATENSVALLNKDERLEALLDIDLPASLLLIDFSSVRAIALARHLIERLGHLVRRARLRTGLYEVDFEAKLNRDDRVRLVLEQSILEPWLTRRHITIHKRLQFPSEAPVIGAGTAIWDCVLVTEQTAPYGLSGLKELFESKRLELQTVVLDTQLPSLAGVEVAAALKANSQPVSMLKVEEATRALDAVLEAAPAANTLVASRERPPALHTAPRFDPVQRAIETREHLEKTVQFVDSKTWAKWKRVRSNPAAALGKYKRQHRAFAVRSSKQDLYPVFQFDPNAEPLAVMRKIIEAVPTASQGWPLLSWFEARNRLLGGEKPSDLLSTEPERVLKAARRFYSRDD